MGVIFQIILHIKHGAGFAALFDTEIGEMLVELIGIGAVGFCQIGIGRGIVIRVKDHAFELIGSAGGGVAGAADINEYVLEIA